jgi:hypothetical protein
MLPAEHALADLQAQAAVGSGWATVHVRRADEQGLAEARAALESALGPLPQADVIEPYDPDDPDEGWELRIDVPGLDLFDVDAIRGAVPDAVVAPGVRPGMRTAEDLGIRGIEVVGADDVEARLVYDSEEGGVLAPDLARGSGADPSLRDLEIELAEAIRAVRPDLAFRSDRGPDTVQPIVHRGSGRFGVQLVVGDESWEHLPGDEATRLREQIVAALGRVVAARADHAKVRLAPDLAFDLRFGLSFVLWFVARAVPGLPGDAPTPEGLSPAGLGALLDGLDGAVEEIELQVVPRTPADHDAVVEQVTALAEAGLPLLGGMPRWVVWRGAAAFAPSWRVLVEEDPVGPAERLSRLSGVGAVRVVPGSPAGYADAWAFADPAWNCGARRWFLRVRDGRRDRDALPKVVQRPNQDRDAAIREAVAAAMAAFPASGEALRGPGWRAIADSTGREGLEIALSAAAMREGPLRAALDALGQIRVDALTSFATWGWRGEGMVVQLWWARSGVSVGSDGPAWG